MDERKGELADRIQTKLGRVLSSQEREVLEVKNSLGASELDIPVVAQTMLGVWKSSFGKIASIHQPGTPISTYASKALLKQAKNFNENGFLIFGSLGGILILIVVLAMIFSTTVSQKFVIVTGAMFYLTLGALMLIDYRRLLVLFQRSEKLKPIILGLIEDNGQLLDVFSCTPNILRDLFLGSPPKDLRGMAKLVAWNLDWYIEQPTLCYRWSWLASIAVIGTSVAICIGLFRDFSFVPAIFCLVIGVNFFRIIHFSESWRKLTGLALLIEETKRIFSEAERK